MNRVGFVFSGQGSQYPGMCKKLYTEDKDIRDCFEEASDILGYDPAEICFGDKTELLNKTKYAQPAIFLASVSQLINFRKKCLLTPDFVAGHSIGEYAALYCAGVLELRLGIELVKTRAELMEREAELNKGAMYDVKNISITDIDDIIKTMRKHGIICISNYNGRDNVVISGEEKVVTKTADAIINRGGSVVKLNVSSGFHSPLMQRAADIFIDKTEQIRFKETDIKIISNLTGLPYTNAAEIKNTLPQQIVSPVKWYHLMKYMEDNGCKTVIEFGPKKVLKNIIIRNTSIEAFSYDDEEDSKLLGFQYSAQKMRSVFFGEFLKEAVIHKNHNNDLSDYSESVVTKYREMEKIYLKMKNEGYQATMDDVANSREYLRTILKYKHISDADIICEKVYNNVFNRLFDGEGIK